MIQKRLTKARYAVDIVNIESVTPSPENESIYGEISHQNDDQIFALIESIEANGLAEPILVTEDMFILSGHRRYFACQWLDYEKIPIRIKRGIKRVGNPDYPALLAEYNPQRVKGAATVLKEALLRFSENPAEVLIRRDEEQAAIGEGNFTIVAGSKTIEPISEKKQEFLKAVQKVVEQLQPYWPLSVRQIHYTLLNDPPLTLTPKRSKFSAEKYRYRNDKESYNALVRLLRPARYLGYVDMYAIDDPTRPKRVYRGFKSAAQFIQQNVDQFLVGFHRDRQDDQPRHIVVLGEKNTILGIIEPVCSEYYVSIAIGRGYGTTPVWRDIAEGFHQSGKQAMTLIVLSDYDPEGMDLADDAIRTLRDLWSLPVDYHRIGVIREQIDELNLQADFNPAKVTSSRINSFIDKTGGTDSWECEALPPDYIQQQLRIAITSNMDMEIYNQIVNDENDDAKEIVEFRTQLIEELGL